jgi:hypothetical protein
VGGWLFSIYDLRLMIYEGNGGESRRFSFWRSAARAGLTGGGFFAALRRLRMTR